MRRLLLVPPDALPARDVFGRDLHPRDYRRYLGQTRSALAWDASGGLYPNAFAALAATLGDGHDLPLYLPAHYPDGDPDHLRLLDYGEAVAACRDHFNARLRRLIHANAAPQTAPPPDSIEHRHQPQIILGRRGRGKTTRLAAKIRWLGGTRVLVVTPYRSNLERLRVLLPDTANCLFLPPDDALNRLPPAEHLVIDEAASIPPAQLLALTAHYPAYTLAATADGYEGHGRSFSLHVLPDEPLLRAIYGLLHQAHYRTSPDDLKHLLDLPGQSLYIAASGADVAGVLHIRHENPLPADLAAAVIRGERRPQGRLLLQQLLVRTQNPTYNRPLARISRIAVHPAHRRQGIAAALIARARADLAVPLGVSYGHSDDLAAFWQALGFREIHRSASDKARPTSLRLSAIVPP